MKTISEELKEAFHKIDLLQRPYILYVNPAQKEKFVQVLKEIGYYDRMVVQETSCVEIDKAYIMERKKLDDWMIP
ncbi:MAG: hypothetical protein IIY09_01670, partial [Clostridia bacterium]|nr:hypothetical protein [Clostridia bacterium]